MVNSSNSNLGSEEFSKFDGFSNKSDHPLPGKAPLPVKTKNLFRTGLSTPDLSKQLVGEGLHERKVLRPSAPPRTTDEKAGDSLKEEDSINDLLQLLESTSSRNTETPSPYPEEKTTEIFKNTFAASSTEEAKTSMKSKTSAVAALFQLNLVPETSDKSFLVHGKVLTPNELKKQYTQYNQDKLTFIGQSLTADSIKEVSVQGRLFPIMNAAVSKIKDNLDRWDDLAFSQDSEGLDELKSELQQQVKNLAALSTVVSSLTEKIEDKLAFAGMTLENTIPEDIKNKTIRTTFRIVLNRYFEGKENLTLPETKTFITSLFRKQIEHHKNELPIEIPPKKHLSLEAIAKQGELIQAMRKSNTWAAAQPSALVKEGTSVNNVFKLYQTTGGEAIAYFKIGAQGEQASGIMEKLMWGAAVIMGMESQFVATSRTQVRTSLDLTGGTEKAALWSEEGELVYTNQAKATLRGGIQTAQQGMTLDKYIKNPPTRDEEKITKNEVINGVLTSVIFGMFDAHGGNLFVTKEGKLQFFDNTRSLPNSNGFVIRRTRLACSYRCCLLVLDEARTKLTPQELTSLNSLVIHYQSKMNTLRAFFEDPSTQSLLDQLPEGWMMPKDSLDAMEQRLELITTSLKRNKITTAEDLALAANPSYKLAFGALLLRKFGEGQIDLTTTLNSIRRKIHPLVGFNSTDEDLEAVAQFGYDIASLKKYCNHPLAIKELSEKILRIAKSRPPHLTSSEFTRIIDEKNQLIEDLTQSAKYDFKDYSREVCKTHVCSLNKQLLELNGVPFMKGSSIAEGFLFALRNSEDRLLDKLLLETDDGFHFLFVTPTGFRSKKINIDSKIEQLTIGSTTLSLELALELFDTYHSQLPKLEDLPLLSYGELQALLLEISPGEIFLGRDNEDNKSLVAGFYVNNVPTQLSFSPGPREGTFLDGPEVLTLEELINKYQNLH